MRRVVGLIAHLAVLAGADLTRARALAGDATGTIADRAGHLVPLPQETLEPEVGRSLGAYGALWLAVALVVLVLALGYARRRWRARHEPGSRPSPVFGRSSARK